MKEACEVAVEDTCRLSEFKLILAIIYEMVFGIIFFHTKRQAQCKNELQSPLDSESLNKRLLMETLL